MARKKPLLVQRAERRIQQSAVERKQGTFRHLGRCWPSTASLLISSRLDFVLPLDLDGPGRESEADDHAQLSLTLIQPMRKSSSSTSSFPSPPPPPPPQSSTSPSHVAMGERRSSRCGYTGSCRRRPAHRRLRPYGRLSLEPRQERDSAAPCATEQPFL